MNKINDFVYYIGVNDHKIDLFEGQYPVPNGMSYNSYLILDKKTCIMDTVEIDFKNEWLKKIKEVLNGRPLDYLVVHHVEPDHSGNIVNLMKEYPECCLVTNDKALLFLKQFYNYDFKNVLIVKENDELDLGECKLKFVFTPFVHWPEVMMSYENHTQTLFSADAFGKFGANDNEEPWINEARRYYYGIIGKFGLQVKMAFNKLTDLNIKNIFSLHGPLLTDNISYYLECYNKWSNYESEVNGVAICFTSIYGNTKEACLLLKEALTKQGLTNVKLIDVARTDFSYALSDAFMYSKIVFASTTYNNDLFPRMDDFLSLIIEHNIQNKKIGLIDNGTWAPQVERLIKAKIEKCKNFYLCEKVVKIRSALSEVNKKEIQELALELSK